MDGTSVQITEYLVSIKSAVLSTDNLGLLLVQCSLCVLKYSATCLDRLFVTTSDEIPALVSDLSC